MGLSPLFVLSSAGRYRESLGMLVKSDVLKRQRDLIYGIEPGVGMCVDRHSGSTESPRKLRSSSAIYATRVSLLSEAASVSTTKYLYL